VSDCVRVSECRLCDSRELDLVVSFPPTPPGDAYVAEPRPQTCYPLDLMSCRICGAVQLADTVDPRLIYTDYTYTTSISVGLDAHFARYATDVIAKVGNTVGGYVLDIGSNDGTLLRAFKGRGYQVLGVDPASTIAQHANATGIPTHCGYFTTETARALLDQHGPASIITANHVMANVADLHDFIDGVKTLLAPDGTFVFETGYWPSIRDGMLIDTIEHEHIHYFAAAPLEPFFERHGLRLVAVEKQPTKGGSLRGFLRHAQHAPLDISVVQSVCGEALLSAFIVKDWPGQLEALRAQMHAVIAKKPTHERWVGYGAAVGSTLLLHYFGLGDVLSELWDDNTRRHGLYSPGFHLPVVAPNHSKADTVVILAWRYAERIRRQHPEHRFLLPLPEVALV
jgi:SAM-dependent methyltransferase